MAEPAVPHDPMRRWLLGWGLEKYADLFVKEEIDFAVLAELTDADLQNLGVPIGSRKKLLKAIDQLKQGECNASVPAQAQRPVEEPERRQLTVMFCDLVGSTALSRRLDPEDMREVLRAYQDIVARHVARFGGHVAQYAGDSITAYFGFPAARENQAELAIRTAKAICDTLPGVDTPAKGALAVRIGIATGLVVVGDLIGEAASQQEMVVGETPNLAARLQTLAEPGATLISATTRQLVGGLFDLQSTGEHELKGFNKPVAAWRVVGERQTASRFTALHATDDLPLIGRESEMAVLGKRWALARQGKGQVVLLRGEPGIGKSLLVQEFAASIAVDAPAVLSYQCWPHLISSSLHPFIANLKLAKDRPDRGSDTGLSGTIKLSLVPELLLSQEEASNQPREKFFKLFADYVRELNIRYPVLIVFEDAHWADPSSLELLQILIDETAAKSILILLTCRPGFTGIVETQTNVTVLPLNRCDRSAVMAMVDCLAGGKELPLALREEIVKRTDGVPLFVEQMTIALLESGHHYETLGQGTCEASVQEIPATLYDCLMVRLDRLGPAKKVAQLASVVGREFSYEVLRSVSRFESGQLTAALNDLVTAEIIYPLQNLSRYTFKHALVQEAAYQSLLGQQRRAIHAKIADVLTEAFPTVCDNEPELLAHHLTVARLDARAIEYWQRAGQRATRMSSYIEASQHLNRALEMLRSLPAERIDHGRELDLMIALATVQLATKGYGAPEVAAAFAEARQRCQKLGRPQQLMTVSFGEWACAHHSQSIAKVVRLGRRLRRLARSSADVGDALMGERALGNSLLFFGKFSEARLYLSHVARAYEACDEDRRQKFALRYGLDLLSASLSLLLVAEWALGHPSEAVAMGERAIAHAEKIRHGNSLAHALIHAGLFLEQFRNRPQQILRRAKSLHELAEGGGFRMFVAWCRVLEGWALFELGDRSKGLTQLQESIRRSQDTGSLLYQPYFLSLLAKSHGALAEYDKGLACIETALDFVDTRQERWYAAEAYRIKGKLMMGSGDIDGASRALDQSLAIARGQHAVAWGDGTIRTP